jgi:hypothetical protein
MAFISDFDIYVIGNSEKSELKKENENDLLIIWSLQFFSCP